MYWIGIMCPNENAFQMTFNIGIDCSLTLGYSNHHVLWESLWSVCVYLVLATMCNVLSSKTKSYLTSLTVFKSRYNSRSSSITPYSTLCCPNTMSFSLAIPQDQAFSSMALRT
jgi:hypothetical protein